MDQPVLWHIFGCSAASSMSNAFFHDCAVYIVRAISKRYLRQLFTQHDPVAFDIIDISGQQRRETAIILRSSKPVGPSFTIPSFFRYVLSGWNLSGMNAWNPCVLFCNSLILRIWSTTSSGVSI